MLQIDQQLVKAIAQYLARCPYQEVAGIMQGLQQLTPVVLVVPNKKEEVK